MTKGFQCPKCKSSKVRERYPNIKCLSCGYSQDLIDFPISWNMHRHYSQEYGRPDPGPCYPEESNLNDPFLGNSLEPDLDRNGYQRIHALEAQVRQLQMDLGHIYSKLSSKQQAAAITRKAREDKYTGGVDGL